MPVEYGEPLSEREIEIVELVAVGLTNREIAIRTYLSHNTVKVHLRNIFTKTGVASRTELTVLAMQEGWITVPGIPEAAAENVPPATTLEMPAVEQPLPPLPSPPWPRVRWAALAVGLILAGMVLFLPQRPVGQAIAPAASGLVDQPQAAIVAAAPSSEKGWQELTPLPVRRARLGVTTYRSQIYVVGGMTEDGLTGRLDIYTPETGEWRSGTACPAALANVGIAALADRLLVPGGCDAGGAPSARTYLYDPANDTWAEGAALPQPLCAYALAAYDGRAYLFGGWNGTTYQAVTYIYDSAGDTWSEAAPPAEARGFGAAATLADRIFYVGGYDDRREWATCAIYLPSEDRWEECAPLLLPRGGLGLAAIGGRLYALGGGWTNYLGFNERYDPAGDTWTVIETPIIGEWRNLGLTAYETSLYAIGGWSGDYINRVYTVEVLPWRVFIPTTFFSP
ncbi:MAG TPA: LuxR C-terminal-related transcriptional regulator [Anaerolineae bacterium]|nr:LuxR C-terminal-related transcriptional regulator [Anaerolineae bacterium]HQH37910.1 LuxR C-terminal-related transcriptional regulator [Anaerolineae bacterium]